MRVLAIAGLTTVLIAAAAGFAIFTIMDGDGSQDGVVPAPADASNGGIEEMIRLAREATAEAQAMIPGAVLYLVAYAGGSGIYTFRFMEPGEPGDVVVVGPHTEPGTQAWEVTRQGSSMASERTSPLDTSSLRKGPVVVIEAATREVPAVTEISAGAHVAMDPGLGEPFWVVSARLSSRSFIECNLEDGAPVSSLICSTR